MGGYNPSYNPGVSQFQFSAHIIRRVCEKGGVDAWLSDLYFLIPKHQADMGDISEVWEQVGVVHILLGALDNSAKQGK